MIVRKQLETEQEVVWKGIDLRNFKLVMHCHCVKGFLGPGEEHDGEIQDIPVVGDIG